MATEDFKRKLTAVFSADVAGYSRLMGEDDDATVRTLTGHRKMMSSLIAKYQGRVVDSPGDNLLAEFESILQAVSCAVEIQREMAERNAELPDAQKMEYRIGVNLGDVIEEGERIYGDGVNIAARLESLAEPGGICISGFVYHQVRNRLKLEYEFMGEQTVKNIKEPVPVYRILSFPGAAAHRVIKAKKTAEKSWRNRIVIAATVVVVIVAALAVWYFYFRGPSIGPSTKEIPSIAVLPFADMSDAPEQEYFSDGITEELISALAKLEGLKVISRTSAFYFKGKNEDLRTIGEKLKVDNVLEGSVRKAGNMLRITAQLINVVDDAHLWAETYDREMKDVFAIQEEISRAIVDNLKVKLLDKQDRPLTKHYTENVEAYGLYIKGRFFLNKGSYNKAVEHFEQALAIDPNYALAYAGLADAYRWIAFFFWGLKAEYYPKAKTAALKALEIDDTLSEAYSSLADIKLRFELDYEGAERAIKRAFELDPGNSLAHEIYARYLWAMGRLDEGIAECKNAIELDPLSVPPYFILGHLLRSSNKSDQALIQYQKAFDLYPNHPLAMAFVGLAYVDVGRYEDGIALVKRALSLTKGKNTMIFGELGYVYGVAGKREEAQKILDEALQRSKQDYFSPNFIAQIYATFGDNDKAFEWLEKGYEMRDQTMVYVKTLANLRSLHSDPRWAQLMKKMGLED